MKSWAALLGLMLGGALLADMALLLRVATDQAPDTVPPQVRLIVLESWASDGATRQAFELAQRFDAAQIFAVGSVAGDGEAWGGCFEGSSMGEKTRAQLVSWGLAPERVIALPQQARGTRNEALAVAAWIDAHAPDAGGLVIVTDWFHRQRSRLTYRTLFRHLEVRVPDLSSKSGAAEWTRRERWAMVAAEFIKLGYYQLRGWISPARLLEAL